MRLRAEATHTLPRAFTFHHVGAPFQHAYMPINDMLVKDQAESEAPFSDQGRWYAPIFEALRQGGSVLVTDKGGQHRSRR